MTWVVVLVYCVRACWGVALMACAFACFVLLGIYFVLRVLGYKLMLWF